MGRRFPIGNRSHFAVPEKRRRKSIERKKNTLLGGREAVAGMAMDEIEKEENKDENGEDRGVEK